MELQPHGVGESIETIGHIAEAYLTVLAHVEVLVISIEVESIIDSTDCQVRLVDRLDVLEGSMHHFAVPYLVHVQMDVVGKLTFGGRVGSCGCGLRRLSELVVCGW